jgi:hypothetical protein
VDTTSIVISNALREQYEPDVASNGTDFWVSGAGVVLDASGLAISTDPVNQHAPKAAYARRDPPFWQ